MINLLDDGVLLCRGGAGRTNEANGDVDRCHATSTVDRILLMKWKEDPPLVQDSPLVTIGPTNSSRIFFLPNTLEIRRPTLSDDIMMKANKYKWIDASRHQ